MSAKIDNRAYTAQEVKDMFLRSMKHLCVYWSDSSVAPEKNIRERMEGLCFSILTTLDGCALELPRFKIVLDPHPDDKQFHIDEGEKYFKPGMEINKNSALHEEWFK
jgi:hypothetical protein